MSTTLLSAFYDIDFLCKTEKSLANLTLNTMLDKKAVGTPVAAAPGAGFAPGFLRRHSASNLHALAAPAPAAAGCAAKFAPAAAPKEPPAPPALPGKDGKFRDRSFSENGERSQQLLHLQQKAGGGAPVNSTRYKTELCRPFEESGACKYGEKCQFAHGFHELRSLTRHPKYKTELCRTFHTIGFCPYGPRCHFIHNADERRPAPAACAASSSPAAAAALGLARPRLHHSLSFSGFPSGRQPPPAGLDAPPPLDSPTSRTPPPGSPSAAAPACCAAAAAAALLFGPGGAEDPAAPAGPALALGPELGGLLAPLAAHAHAFAAALPRAQPPGLPPSPPFGLAPPPRRRADSPAFDAPPSPPDSLSDRDSYLSGSLSSGSLSGSESPGLDPGRRLPIFSRLSVSDD
ncbi:mRNA decay activator protein ZFP36L2 [Ctenodactylus gundi]